MYNRKQPSEYLASFKLNNFRVNQLISITHSILGSFGANASLEVRDVFLDLSKALERI